MKYQKIIQEKPILLLLIPALAAFLIALVTTLKYQWPLGGDIFYHVHLAKLYLEQGFSYWDPLTAAPYGRPIFYPPLFHFLLLSLSFLFGVDIFQAARFLQPVLFTFITLSFSVVAYKLTKSNLIGVSAGFFIFFSVAFQRFLLSGPENLAFIMFPWVIYGFYRSLENKNYRYALFSGLLTGIILLTHALSGICLLLIISIYSLLIGVKNKFLFRYLILFLFIAFIVASTWWLPLIINYSIPPSLQANFMLSLQDYIAFLGLLTLIFAFLGAVPMIKRRSNLDILLITAFVSLLGISGLNYLGIPILSNRILTFAVFPLVVMAGIGLEYMKFKFEEKKFPRKYFNILLVMIYFAAILSAYSMLADFNKAPSWLRASDSEIDVAEWFKTNGDKKNVVVAYDYRDTFIVAIANQPVALGGYGQGIPKSLDLVKYTTGKASRSDFINDRVGYIVQPVGMKNPPYTLLVHQNADYAVYMFNNSSDKS